MVTMGELKTYKYNTTENIVTQRGWKKSAIWSNRIVKLAKKMYAAQQHGARQGAWTLPGQ